MQNSVNWIPSSTCSQPKVPWNAFKSHQRSPFKNGIIYQKNGQTTAQSHHPTPQIHHQTPQTSRGPVRCWRSFRDLCSPPWSASWHRLRLLVKSTRCATFCGPACNIRRPSFLNVGSQFYWGEDLKIMYIKEWWLQICIYIYIHTYTYIHIHKYIYIDVLISVNNTFNYYLCSVYV